MSQNPNNPYSTTPPQQQPQDPSSGNTLGQGIQLGGKVINSVMKPNGGMAQSAMSSIPGMAGSVGQTISKFIPYAGMVTGGLGMLQNKGLLSNISSGFTTGASIGSIVPGLGTLVGGGIGAGVGALESWIGHMKGPNQTERQGRATSSDAVNQIGSGASQQQQDEAQNAVRTGGWKNANDALSLIVTRDALIKQGMDPQQAIQQSNKMVGDLFKTQKQGSQAVSQAYSPIQALMGTSQGSNSNPQAQAQVGGVPARTPSAPPRGLITDAFSRGALGS